MAKKEIPKVGDLKITALDSLPPHTIPAFAVTASDSVVFNGPKKSKESSLSPMAAQAVARRYLEALGTAVAPVEDPPLTGDGTLLESLQHHWLGAIYGEIPPVPGWSQPWRWHAVATQRAKATIDVIKAVRCAHATRLNEVATVAKALSDASKTTEEMAAYSLVHGVLTRLANEISCTSGGMAQLAVKLSFPPKLFAADVYAVSDLAFPKDSDRHPFPASAAEEKR